MQENGNEHRSDQQRNLEDSSIDRAHFRDEEISISDIVKGLWRLRTLIVLSMLVPLSLAIIWVIFEKIRNFERTTEYVIEFRFEGRSNDQYPNGLPFSIGDIVSPAVLSSVYETEKVVDYGLSLRDFQSAVSVAPYTPDRRLILEKHTVDQRKATVAEINEAQASLAHELSAAQQRYAVLGFTTGNADIPQAKIDRILMEVARAWEKHAIETRGVLRIDARMISPDIFQPERLDGLTRLNGLRYMRNVLDELAAMVERISTLPGGLVIRDTETGNDVSALRWQVNRAALQLIEVPAGWTNAISNDGQIETQGLPINVYPPTLFDEADLEGQDYLIAVDMLRQRIRLIKDNVSRILSVSFGDTVRDPVSSLTARDVDRRLFDLEEFTVKLLSAPVLQLGISNNPEMVRLYYDSRLDELQREKATLASKARIVEQAIQNYQGMVGGLNSAAPADVGGIPPASSTVIPQFGDAFIDRLIELSQRGGDTQFRQDLLSQTINYQRSAADIEAEIARIEEYIRVFSSGGASSGGDPVLARQFIEELDEKLPETMVKLREYADITTRLAYRMRYAQDIHAIVNVGEEASVQVDYYLRDVASGSADSRKVILQELMDYAIIANRLHAEISRQALGAYQRLFSAAGNPAQVGQRLVSRIELLIIVLAALAGGVFGLLFGIARQLLRSPARS